MRPMHALILAGWYALAILGVFYLVLPAWLKGAATARCAQDLPIGYLQLPTDWCETDSPSQARSEC